MTKITPDHLARSAYVYVRQSTPGQLLNNPESRRRQYALATRAHALGWGNVIVIDDDLGRSGGGTARPGFERLLAAICTGTAGAVLAIEASRLARNGRDWHTLLEFCALMNSLIIDEDGVYDSRQINDRMLLGMKGAFSELELSILRQRSQGFLRALRRRVAICTRPLRSATCAAPMIGWNWIRTAACVPLWPWCSASLRKSAASGKSPCGSVMRASRCQRLSIARTDE